MLHTLEITSLAHGGDGIGRIEGQVCFVPFGLPGDTLKIRVTRSTKNALWAEIAQVLQPSPHRADAACSNFGRCGMCTWGHFAYPAQADWKRNIVQDTLRRIGGIEAEFAWIEDPSLRVGYRTRAEYHGDGELLGVYAPGSHTVVEGMGCPLAHPRLNAALERLRPLGIKGAVTVTVNPLGDEVLVWTGFVRRNVKDYFPLANAAQEDGPRAQFVFDGIPVVNGTFSQASLLLNRLLVHETHAAIGAAASVLDLYCGSGNLSLGLAERARVVGVDHNRAAIQAAAALRTGEYVAGGEDRMAALAAREPWDVILLDPPRAGAKAIAPALAAAQARAIVYVSCDPATLARDLKTLAASGWRLTRAAALDLFPNTPHVETVCRLER